MWNSSTANRRSRQRAVSPRISETEAFAVLTVHGPDRGFRNDRVRRALALSAQHHEPASRRGVPQTVLHHLERLVVFEPEKAGRPHQISLPQAMPTHLGRI